MKLLVSHATCHRTYTNSSSSFCFNENLEGRRLLSTEEENRIVGKAGCSGQSNFMGKNCPWAVGLWSNQVVEE